MRSLTYSIFFGPGTRRAYRQRKLDDWTAPKSVGRECRTAVKADGGERKGPDSVSQSTMITFPIMKRVVSQNYRQILMKRLFLSIFVSTCPSTLNPPAGSFPAGHKTDRFF